MTDRLSRLNVSLALAICPFFSSLTLSDETQCPPELAFVGNQVAASYARAVAGAGDVDGDGVDDLIVGIAGYDSAVGDNAGKAIVYSGATGLLIRAWLGETTESLFGHAVDGIGDVNGDDRADVVVGAPIYDAVTSQIGKIYVLSGATGQLLWSKIGKGPEDQFGWSVAAAGDVDGDQVPDVIVGARAPGPLVDQPGKAYVYSGADGRLIWNWEGEEEGDWFGASVAGAGDIDNDGFADLIVGAPRADGQAGNSSGKAFVFSGSNGQLIWGCSGEAGSAYGSAVSSAGDVDGDEMADCLVSAPNHFNPPDQSFQGKVDLYSGRTRQVMLSWVGEASGDLFGFDVSAAGDFDGDGRPDIIVGAQYGGDAAGFGKVYLYSGTDGRLLRSWIGESYFDLFGTSISGAGDINGDGRADIIVGAQFYDGPPGSNSGKAYVFLGRPVADLDCDDVVGVADLAILLGDWGLCTDCLSDLDGDAIVGVIDLLMLLRYWG